MGKLFEDVFEGRGPTFAKLWHILNHMVNNGSKAFNYAKQIFLPDRDALLLVSKRRPRLMHRGAAGEEGKAGRITYRRPAVPACCPEISHRARDRSPIATSPEAPGLVRFRGPAITPRYRLKHKCHRLVFLRPGRVGLG
jgi:hypothetical protein